MEEIQTPKYQQRNLYLKIVFILFLILLLMIPNALIQELTNERQGLEHQVQTEIASGWGPEQTIAGPILTIPFKIQSKSKDIIEYYKLRVLPESVAMDVNMQSEERQKSIYSTILYNADHKMAATFKVPSPSEFGSQVDEILWSDATIDIGFSSASGLDDIVYLEWEKKSIKMNAGASDSGLFESAIHCDVDIDPEQKEYSLSTNFGINGCKQIRYVPCANNTSITMSSDWQSPGFIGLPLPRERDIRSDGFTATWKATEYNRSFRSSWVDSEFSVMHQSDFFGVSLIEMVGHYQKNMRSSKYALLIIGLSFIVFFFFEILKGIKIHPVQYAIVGVSLSIFYLLLLSFTEHLGFNKAYLIASLAVVSLIGWYSIYLFRNIGRALMLATILAILYAYVFVLLQMEEFALLTGSIGLFIALVITMYLSRNFDWYQYKLENKSDHIQNK